MSSDETFAAFASQLVEHLRKRKPYIVESYDFVVEISDPTYGGQPTHIHFEVVDFDALLREIDAFGDELRGDETRVK